MTVMELKALPLGFRFHPTDEELIRHYLKGKITGQIKADEVIPEIDVCKIEPWDLPDKSLIHSDDPEWFFFAPKDRKYPNGSRSNRATEAGYWKATGKDRVIKSKGDKKKQHMIGMKKTLVFHRGRAPKGVRTGWIMHEYRTTEPEFESGEQGGYVLYRLFRKPDDRTERPSVEEIDRSGYSPTPSRSTPDNMEANEEAITPSNKESPESGLHESPIDLPGPIEPQAAPITRWLADKTDNRMTNEANIPGVPSHGHVDGGAKDIPSAGALGQSVVLQQQTVDPYGMAATVSAPMLPFEDPDFFNSIQAIGNFDGNMKPHDPLQEFLNQTLADPDEHSSTTSKVNYDSDTGNMPIEFDNHGIMQGEFVDDQNWLENFNFMPDHTNPQFSSQYENAALLPYDSTDQDVLSMDSGTESLQDLFNSMEDSNVKRDTWSNEPILQGTGFTAMHRQFQSDVHPNYIFTHQGNARRRLQLQTDIEGGEFVCRDECEDELSCVVSSEYLNEAVEESTAEKDITSDADDAESTGITIMCRRPDPRASSDSSFTQHGTAVRRLRLQVDLTAAPCSNVDDSSSCIIDESQSNDAEKAEIEDNANTNLAESVDLSGTAHDDEQRNISEHDSSTVVPPDAKSVPRLRKTAERSDNDQKQEGSVTSVSSHVRAPTKKRGFPSYFIWLVFSVALILTISIGLYAWV